MTIHTKGKPQWNWLAGVALLAGGMAIGAALYSFWSNSSTVTAPPHAETEEDLGHAASDSGRVEIPLKAQQESGLKVEKAALRPFRASLRATGVVGADQSRVAHIRTLARGVVDEVFVQLGSQVSKGQHLLSYDNIDLGMAIGEYLSATSALRASRTDLDVKERILERSAEMLRVGAVARTTHDIREAEHRSAQSSVDNAQSNVAKFEEQLHRFGLNHVDMSRLSEKDDSGYHRTASHTSVKAPRGGVVTAYNVNSGETVDPSSELLTSAT